jgi:hypothetical protein
MVSRGEQTVSNGVHAVVGAPAALSARLTQSSQGAPEAMAATTRLPQSRTNAQRSVRGRPILSDISPLGTSAIITAVE